MGNTAAQPAPNAANGILKNATMAVSLKYLNNFWRSIERPLINCKVDLELSQRKHCVLFVAGIGNANGKKDDDNIILTIKDTKLFILVVTL